MSEVLAALERARLVTIDTRCGQAMRCALAPAAFGHPVPDTAPPVIVPPSRPSPMPQAAASAPAAPAAPAAAAGATVAFIGEFAGTPIYAPPGTPLVLECDVDGRWSWSSRPTNPTGTSHETEVALR